jgi:hypothetical protein
MLSIGAQGIDPSDTVPLLMSGHTGASLQNTADSFVTRHIGHGDTIDACSLIDVNIVDASSF